MKNQNKSGFSTLIAVTVISASISILLIPLAIEAFSLSGQIAHSTERFLTYYRLRSCAAVALSEYTGDKNYPGSSTHSVSGGSCTIESIAVDPNHITIITSSRSSTELLRMKSMFSTSDMNPTDIELL